MNAFTINHVTEELYFGNPNFTLGKFCIQLLFIQQLQYYIQHDLRALLVLGLDQNIVLIKTRCLRDVFYLEPSIGDNLTLGQSSSRYSTLEAGLELIRQFLGAAPVSFKVALSSALKATIALLIIVVVTVVVVVVVVMVVVVVVVVTVVVVVVVVVSRPYPTVPGQMAN
ncbi:hypothetical protein Tco_0321294 [Tanacetum coccineum]